MLPEDGGGGSFFSFPFSSLAWTLSCQVCARWSSALFTCGKGLFEGPVGMVASYCCRDSGASKGSARAASDKRGVVLVQAGRGRGRGRGEGERGRGKRACVWPGVPVRRRGGEERRLGWAWEKAAGELGRGLLAHHTTPQRYTAPRCSGTGTGVDWPGTGMAWHWHDWRRAGR